MIPGLSPSSPALKEPSMLTSSGLLGWSPSKLSKSLTSSPQYQVFRSLAWANQSSVFSTRSPSLKT